MSEKPKQKVDSVFRKKTRLEKIAETIKKKILTNDRFWAVFTIIILVILLGPEIDMQAFKYELGDIARTTIKSPEDITVEDTTDIESRKQEALKAALPVFDYRPDVQQEAVARINNYFNQGRLLLADFMKEKSITDAAQLANSQRFRTARKQLLERMSDILPIKPNENILKYHISKSFNINTQDLSLVLANRTYEYYILETTQEMQYLGENGFIKKVHEGETVSSEKVDSTQLVRTMDELPSLIYQESVSMDLPPNDKVLLRQFVELLITPNMKYNSTLTEEAKTRAISSIEPVYYRMKKGEVIVREGDIINKVALIKISALSQQRSTTNFYLKLLGTLLIIILVILASFVYTGFFTKRYLKVDNLFILFVSILLLQILLLKLSIFLSEGLIQNITLSPLNQIETYYWALPFAVGALLLTSLVNQQIAIIFTIVVSALAGMMTGGSFYVALYALGGSFTGIYSVRHYRERTAILKSAMVVSVSNVIFVAGINLYLVKGSMQTLAFELLAALVGGLLVAFFASFLLPVLESIFGIATDIKLLELSSMDRELLRRLSTETPGTYQHSVMVGTLAESAATEISANPLFCRVATLYHDIGKLEKPEYFVENNTTAPKLHRKQKPHLSALILVNHVKRGIQMAKDHKLPQSIIDIIPQHHGTRLIGSFYQLAKELSDPDIDEIKESDFRYPGPKPQSKEAAIIMIADSVEAASRTLKSPTPQKIRAMVEEIVNSAFMDGQFDECQLTMIDLRKIIDAMSRKLATMFHGRVEYPQYSFNRDEKENRDEENSNGKKE